MKLLMYFYAKNNLFSLISEILHEKISTPFINEIIIKYIGYKFFVIMLYFSLLEILSIVCSTYTCTVLGLFGK